MPSTLIARIVSRDAALPVIMNASGANDVGVAEGLRERVRLPDVALAVLHLRPAAGGIEGPPCDADDTADPIVGLQ